MFGFNIGPRLQLGSEDGTIGNVLTLIVGLIGVVWGFSLMQAQATQLDNSVNTSATVVKTSVVEDITRRGSVEYYPNVMYRYTFEGQEYTEGNMYPGGQEPDGKNLRSEAESVVQNYTEGSQITVQVPPGNPDESFIKAKKTNDPLILILFGVIFTGFSGYRLVGERYI